VAVWLSAQSGQGQELLAQALSELLSSELFAGELCLNPQDSRLRAILYEMGAIKQEQHDEQGNILVTVRLQRHDFNKALAKANVAPERFLPPQTEAWH
jgi:GTP-binding protein HflX